MGKSGKPSLAKIEQKISPANCGTFFVVNSIMSLNRASLLYGTNVNFGTPLAQEPRVKYQYTIDFILNSSDWENLRDSLNAAGIRNPEFFKEGEFKFRAQTVELPSHTYSVQTLNQYNRKKGTYGNNDGKDASHKGGKIVGFEKESTNRGRREKSRLKKESILKLRQMIREELLTEKKELGGALINKIERLTDVNNHTEARMTLAKEVDKNLWKAYEGLNAVQDYLRRANETNIARNALDTKLFALAKKKFSDYDSIAGAF